MLAEDGEGQVELLGALKTPMREALDVLLETKMRHFCRSFEQIDKNVNIVCNDSMPYSDSGWCADCLRRFRRGRGTTMLCINSLNVSSSGYAPWYFALAAVAQPARRHAAGARKRGKHATPLMDASLALLQGTEIEEFLGTESGFAFASRGGYGALVGGCRGAAAGEAPREPAPRLPLQDAMPRAKHF